MIGAVEQDDLDVHQRVAGEDAVLHGVLGAGVHRRNVLARDAPTGDLVLELVGGTVLADERFECDEDLGELTRATRLLLVSELDLVDRALDGLLVGHLRLADVGLDLELATHPVDQNIEVKLAHTADDGLAGLVVLVDLEGRVLFGQLLDGQGKLLLVTLRLGLDGDLDDRIRERHRLEDDLAARVTQGVTGGGVLESDHGVDMAGRGGLHRVLLIGVHLEQLAQPLLLALGGVDHLGTGVDLARVHADVGQLAEERVGGDLEGQPGEWLINRRLPDDFDVFLARRVTDSSRNVQRRGQVVDHRIEHGLDALVLERRTAQHRVGLGVDGQLAQGTLDLVDGEFLTAEVLFEQSLISLGDGLEHLGAVLGGLLDHIVGDVNDVVLLAELGLAAPHLGLHLDQVDDTLEATLGTDRQLDRDHVGAEAFLHGPHREIEVRADLVHLVDETDAGHVVLVGLSPHLLGLGLDALLAVEDGDGAIEHAQAALHLDGEVDVSRGVDDVDLVVIPEAGGGRGGDRDPALLLLFHPVHGGGAVVHLTDLVAHTGVVEDALGGRRLAGIDVRHDADIADLVEVSQHILCHRSLPNLCVNEVVGWPAAGPGSPAVVREGPVRLSHLVDILAPLHGGAQTIAGVKDFVGQPLDHGLLATSLGEAHQPAQRERGRAIRTNLDGHLVGGSTDAAAAHLKGGLDVVQRTLEGDNRVGAGLIASLLEGSVDDALSQRLLAVHQNLVDQLSHQLRAVNGIVDQRALGCGALAGH